MFELSIAFKKLPCETEEEQGGRFAVGKLMAHTRVDTKCGTGGRVKRLALSSLRKSDVTLQHIDYFMKLIYPFRHAEARAVHALRESNPIGGKGNRNRT